MSTRTASLVSAAGLFILAWWFVLRPAVHPPMDGQRAGSVEVPRATPLASPVISPGSAPVPPPPTKKSLAVSTDSSASNPGPTAMFGTGPALARTSAAANLPGTGDGAQARAAQVDIVKVRVMLKDFHTLTGENPVGTNAEIMQALMGANPRQAKLGPPEGMSLNGKGELVDPWQTPYFFHQLSKDLMEIRSAGPDKVLWTNDDIIAR